MTPTGAPQQCVEPGCPNLVTHGGRCSECAHLSYAANRPSPRAVGYDAQWERERKRHLELEPWCRSCGAGIPATDVDHVIPHRGERWLFDLPGNRQSLCSLCHKTKSGHEAHDPLDLWYPLDLPEPRRPVTLVCGPLIEARGASFDMVDGNRLPYSDRNRQLRYELTRTTKAPLLVILPAPRHAERAFWSHVLKTTAILTPPSSIARAPEWWDVYRVDAEALDRMDARQGDDGAAVLRAGGSSEL